VEVTPAQAGVIYAEEADVLNVAMFGMTGFSLTSRSPCGMPWSMNTAFRFSILERQISSLMEAWDTEATERLTA